LNLSFFIGKRIAFNKQQSFSRFIIRLSVAATAVSVAAMIITLASVNGFQRAVAQKVFSFWGHIRVQHYEANKALVAEENPIEKNDTVVQLLKQQPDVVKVQAYATKSAVLEKNKEIEGILFKGVEADYDSSHVQPFIKEGRWINMDDTLYGREILVAQPFAKALNLHVQDTVKVYFIDAQQGKSIYRPLRVAGIFRTGIDQYDNLFVLGDIRLLRRLNNWPPNTIGGYEVFLKDPALMDTVNAGLYLPDIWACRTVKEVYPDIFDWLNILNVNRVVIFVVMAIVAIINLVTCLLILVLERTKMIGVLKATGAGNGTIQRIFLYYAGFITLSGVGLGFTLGVGICLLQQYTGLITLNESAYYVSVAPIHIIWWQVAAVCVATFVVCVIALIVPTLLVQRIKPVKAIQFR
jgi:lipoprotein-releasing system permease protein